MDTDRCISIIDKRWEDEFVPLLSEYIRIPNKSPAFDAEWAEHGHMHKAIALLEGWAKEQKLDGMVVEIVELEGRTPVLFMEIPGEGDDCVLLYGHYDKQPEMTGWSEGLGPWIPVRKDDKLYGRGGADDGYATFASVAAIAALRECKGKHARCVVLIEGCEESGSFDLPYYIDHLKDRIGNPTLVVCLDSGCGNYDQLWCTTSLRGLLAGNLRVDVMTEGAHSGDASGIMPESFRIIRSLLDRLEDPATGEMRLPALQAKIPAARVEQAKLAGEVIGKPLYERFPRTGTAPMSLDPAELVLNRTWRSYVAITGVDGLPPVGNAGNVLRPYTTLRLSMRLPPNVDPETVRGPVTELLEKDPPYGAKVSFKVDQIGPGWEAPALTPWLEKSVAAASDTFFGKPALYMGEGGSIPFMGMLGEKFPDAQFMITGVLGPGSNAHGPNEFLHLTMGKRLTCCVAQVLEDHFHRAR